MTSEVGEGSEGRVRAETVPAIQPIAGSGSHIRVPLAYVEVMAPREDGTGSEHVPSQAELREASVCGR